MGIHFDATVFLCDIKWSSYIVMVVIFIVFVECIDCHISSSIVIDRHRSSSIVIDGHRSSAALSLWAQAEGCGVLPQPCCGPDGGGPSLGRPGFLLTLSPPRGLGIPSSKITDTVKSCCDASGIDWFKRFKKGTRDVSQIG